MKPLKIIYNNLLPFPGYKAMTFFNIMFVRKEYKGKELGGKTYNHESIHQLQAYDFGIGFFGYFIFYLWYLIEWLLKLPSFIFKYAPYYSISFEQEAYANENDYRYLTNRKRFAWLKYVFKFKKSK